MLRKNYPWTKGRETMLLTTGFTQCRAACIVMLGCLVKFIQSFGIVVCIIAITTGSRSERYIYI